MKKLFTSDKFFLTMVLCAVIAETAVFGCVCLYDTTQIMHYIPLLLRVCCVIMLYITYKKHSKNVMKGMMGALLMGQLIAGVTLLSYDRSAVWFNIVYFLLTLLIFVNHFIINSDHHSSPTMVHTNQLATLTLAIVNTVNNLQYIFTRTQIIVVVGMVLESIGFIGLMCSIVCVESRLDAYRLDREAAGWTEEKGYPKDYVHEYEKNKK